MEWVVNVNVTQVPIEVLPWQSPTHSKDSTVQRLPWTYCENRDKVNDSQQRLRMVTPTIEGFHSCVDPSASLVNDTRWMWTLFTVKQRLLHGWLWAWITLFARCKERVLCCDAIYEEAKWAFFTGRHLDLSQLEKHRRKLVLYWACWLTVTWIEHH